MPSSNGEVDSDCDGEEGVDVVVGAKDINIVFSFTHYNNFKLVNLDLDWDFDFSLPHKYSLVHH